MHNQQAAVQKQKKGHATQANPRTASKATVAAPSSGLLALQGQIGNGAVQRQLAQRQKAAGTGINPFDPAMMGAAVRGVIKQSEAPVRN